MRILGTVVWSVAGFGVLFLSSCERSKVNSQDDDEVAAIVVNANAAINAGELDPADVMGWKSDLMMLVDRDGTTLTTMNDGEWGLDFSGSDAEELLRQRIQWSKYAGFVRLVKYTAGSSEGY